MGTASASSPAAESSSKFSKAKPAWRSSRAARAANPGASRTGLVENRGGRIHGPPFLLQRARAYHVASSPSRPRISRRRSARRGSPRWRGYGRSTWISALIRAGRSPEHNDTVCEEQCLLHVMGDQQCGKPGALPQRYQFRLHGDPRQRIQLSGWLIEHGVFFGSLTSARASATRCAMPPELVRIGVAKSGQAHELQGRIDPAPFRAQDVPAPRGRAQRCSTPSATETASDPETPRRASAMAL